MGRAMRWGLTSWRKRRAGNRFLADRRGSVSVEFTMLAIPFALLIFTTIESCVSFAAQEVMANATHDVSRLILTGKIRAADVDEAKLKTMLCQRMSIMAPTGCTQNIVVDLETYPTFADAAKKRIKIANGDLDTNGFKVEVGGAGTKSMLRVFYKWPIISSFKGTLMPTTLAGGKMLHFASEVWQNEPFPDV